MPPVDRGEILARVNLAALATETCGDPVGRGRSAKWHCPNPAHPDEHPSMGVYQSKAGHPRWKCHSCGEGGTAIDLLMVSGKLSAGQALRELAARAGLRVADHPGPVHPRPPARPAGPSHPPPATSTPGTPNSAIERFVAQTADLLWQRIGASARWHLHHRGFTPPILRANRIGYDPGPRELPRPAGLPRRGPGIVYPVLDAAATAIYYQVRYLDPTTATRKYDQPIAELAANPVLAHIRTPTPVSSGALVVCEGIPDGLTAAHAGLAAVAVLGASHQPEALASRLTPAAPGAVFLLAFDPDPAGTTAGHFLAAHLARRGATVACLRPDAPDLNAWWQTNPTTVTQQLTATARMLNPVSVPTADLTIVT